MDKWLEVSIKVTHEAVEAVAEMLREQGARNGVAIDDPVLINNLRNSGTWELTDIPEQIDTEVVTVTAYYPDDEELKQRLNNIEKELAVIENRIGKFRFGPTMFRKISEHDWANEWKQYFHVTRVGKSIVIKPTWEDYTPKAGDKVLHLDPGMAFGTGTHHTTNMCMQILEEIVEPDMTVFDVGCGSGILAMTAALLGAKKIKAVDIDGTAVRVAKENIALNKLSNAIDIAQGDLLHGTEGKADIIVANIIADIIIMLLPDIPGKLKPNGKFLASGIIDDRLADIETEAAKAGMKIIEVQHKGGWSAVLMEVDPGCIDSL